MTDDNNIFRYIRSFCSDILLCFIVVLFCYGGVVIVRFCSDLLSSSAMVFRDGVLLCYFVIFCCCGVVVQVVYAVWLWLPA